jgi:hypothetical protein
MLRLAGGIMILTGSVGLGVWYRSRLYERIETIKYLIYVTELFISNISFNKATMPECCLRAGEQLKSDKLSAGLALSEGLIAVHEIMSGNEGYEFDVIFEKTMLRYMEKCTLERTDIEDFMKIARTGIYSDLCVQLKALENIKSTLTEKAEVLKKDVDNKGRIMLGLGTLGGIFLLIVLL